MTTGLPRVVSGIQPSGDLHLGSYLGAIRNWVADQDKYDNFMFVANLHAMTVTHDAYHLRKRTLDVAALYIACGIDPQRSTIFVQSDVSQHAELGWLIQCFTPMGWLERMTQFKDKSTSSSRERVSSGLFTYPTLMAADILLYDADFVPVGDDQRQHIELCRDVAQRFNTQRGEVFKVPKPLIRDAGARIMGLDDPEIKMSKSIGVDRPGHAVFLLDEPSLIRKKFKRAKTDAEPSVRKPLGAGVANLIDIYAATLSITPDEAYSRLEGSSYGELKTVVGDAVADTLEPIQERYQKIRGDEAALRDRLDDAAVKARVIAAATLDRVYTSAGLL
jgi:tryptophanyl-tRNA synthetase